MTDTADHIEQLADLVHDVPIAMISTRQGQTGIAAQPFAMQTAEHRFDGDLWFLISIESSTAERIADDPVVGVSLAAGDTWVSITGHAEVDDDRSKAERLWSASAEAWFPDGPDDARIRTLIVHADGAEYWDTPGGRVATVLSFVKSKVTGEPLEVDSDKLDL
jgi:general stress protein 26